ncbi:Phosphatidylinositide phosphatase SAC2 [Portunus trituberculatus]|uniref:Phosphatidylinositide phosphatase SAC2 n=1 Tax=Portunus trituberculatus TaxID=210409 RepID=A0A5B7E3S0_PORTR|nr:Phosphatidylinositide phosphatase SAC2 [Portunus trituberculatus]
MSGRNRCVKLQLQQDEYNLTLISRRSRHRAGTRYKRRGVDEEGRVANYVETEQIISYSHHRVAFVQVRGSVPVFWSQPGYKYRPPPRLDKDPTETATAFGKHFDVEVKRHGHVSCVSLVEQSGKEKVIADAFLNNILTLDSPSLTFITFDFHDRGMRYENVSVLLEGIEELITKMLYCWVDKEGTICRQNGVFRINCIDCLDRTNVVQGDFTRTGERRFAGMMKDGMNSANRYYRNHFLDTYRQVAIDVMLGLELSNSQWQEIDYVETLLSVAGALMPIGPPSYMAEIAPASEKYLASALYSLSRYYMNRFKDAYRQATIDHLLGNPVTEDIMNLEASGEEEESSMTPEHVKHVIDDCKKLLVPDAETILGAWGLIDADPSRAFTNVTSGLARLNPMSTLRLKRPSSVTGHQPSAKFYMQKPPVCVQDVGQDELASLGGSETHLASCGVLASSLMSAAYPPRYLSPPLVRCQSDSALLRSHPGEQVPANPSPNPEILVSGTVETSHSPSITPTFGGLSPTLLMQRVRKISHSSDEVDVRDEREGGVARASSATDLQLHLPSSHSEGHIGTSSGLGNTGGELTSLVSPLSSLNKEAVLAPFSVLARGMQSLAPGAGRLARGMQSIGVNLDPRRLRAQRQRQLEEDPVFHELPSSRVSGEAQHLGSFILNTFQEQFRCNVRFCFVR